MAQYASIPKDLSEIKQKFLFGLTRRQVICFGIASAMGFPVFFLTKGVVGTTVATLFMAIVAAPAIICGIYKKNGLYFEKRAKYMLNYFRSPQIKTYQSENVFEQISNAQEYYKLKKILNLNAKKGWKKHEHKLEQK